MSDGPVAAVELQPSEAAILAAASRMFAAYVAAGSVSQDSEESIMEYCVQVSIRMALRIDRLLQSDDEATGLRTLGSAL